MIARSSPGETDKSIQQSPGATTFFVAAACGILVWTFNFSPVFTAIVASVLGAMCFQIGFHLGKSRYVLVTFENNPVSRIPDSVLPVKVRQYVSMTLVQKENFEKTLYTNLFGWYRLVREGRHTPSESINVYMCAQGVFHIDLYDNSFKHMADFMDCREAGYRTMTLHLFFDDRKKIIIHANGHELATELDAVDEAVAEAAAAFLSRIPWVVVPPIDDKII